MEAELSAERANEAADLLAGMFQSASPDYADGREVTTREALDEGVVRVGRLESPSLRAYLNRVLAETYIHIGDPRIADSLLQASLGLVGRDATSEEASRIRRLLMSTRDAMADYEGVSRSRSASTATTATTRTRRSPPCGGCPAPSPTSATTARPSR